MIGFYRFAPDDPLDQGDADPERLGIMMSPWETGVQQLQLRYKTTLKSASGEDERFVKGFSLLGVAEASTIAHEFGHGIACVDSSFRSCCGKIDQSGPAATALRDDSI